MQSITARVLLVCAVLCAVSARASSHLDVLEDSDLRAILEEKGVSSSSFRTRSALIQRIMQLESSNDHKAAATPRSRSSEHKLQVLYCSG